MGFLELKKKYRMARDVMRTTKISDGTLRVWSAMPSLDVAVVK